MQFKYLALRPSAEWTRIAFPTGTHEFYPYNRTSWEAMKKTLITMHGLPKLLVAESDRSYGAVSIRWRLKRVHGNLDGTWALAKLPLPVKPYIIVPSTFDVESIELMAKLTEL